MAGRPWSAIAAALVLATALAGCSRAAHRPRLEDLLVSNRRFSIDEDRGLVRVFARLENTGTGHFRQIEVHAMLVSTSGDKRGENSLVLENIGPREKRDFSLNVTSHDRTHDVVLAVRETRSP